MLALKRNYWAVAFGSFINLVAKLLLLTVSIFLIMKASQITDPLFTLIAYFVLIISLIWILGLNYFFQKIFLDSKQGIIIQNFGFFKTTIAIKRIKSIRVFQTFFDKKFNTYSLRVSFLDEDEDIDEIIIHGIDAPVIKLLNEKFKDAVHIIFDVSIPKPSKGTKSLKSKKSSKLEYDALFELLEKRFRLIWLFNVTLLVVLIVMFVVFFTKSPYPHEERNLNINNEKHFSKMFVFNNSDNSSMEPLYFYENTKGKYVLYFEIPYPFYETSKSFSLTMHNKDIELLKYSFDMQKFEPKKVEGPCFIPGVVNTGADNGRFEIVFDYNTDEPLCNDPNRVVIEFNLNDSVVSFVGLLSS